MVLKFKTCGCAAVVAVTFAYAFFGLPANEANAQSSVDPYVLNDRINRLEEEIYQLQNSTGINRARSLQKNRIDGDPTSEANLSLRLGDIEEQMRALNGKIEETSFQIRQLTEKFTRFSEDVEFRFQDLKASPQPRSAQRKQQKINPDLTTKSLGTISSSSLGTISGNSTGTKSARLAQAQASTGSPRSDYNRAFGMIKQRKYAEAEAEFKAFISRYPKNALSGNAQYWLGETYFARKQDKKAADAFLRGYTRFRTSAKAPDSLLKLGITLARLGQKDAACSAFDEMRIEFPRTPRNTRDRVKSEQRRVGC